MRTKTKNLLWIAVVAFVFSFAFVLAFVPNSLVANASTGTGSEADPYVVTTYAELKDLMANAPTNGSTRYIKLGGDITSTDSNNNYYLTLTDDDQKVVLDLAGYNITRNPEATVDSSVVRLKKGTLTINDSMGGGGIYAYGEYMKYAIFSSPSGPDTGNLILNEGTISSENSLYGADSPIYMVGGSTVTINGGSIKGNNCGLDHTGGNLYIYGGEFFVAEDSFSLRFTKTIGIVRLYNLTAHKKIDTQGNSNTIWNHIPTKTVKVDNVAQDSNTLVELFTGTNIQVIGEAINTVSATGISAPVYSYAFTNSLTIPDGAKYTAELAWLQNGFPASGDDYASETVYEAEVTATANAGYYFANNVTGTINGNTAQVSFNNNDLVLKYLFPETGNKIPATLNGFYAGNKFGSTSLSTQTNYYTISIEKWYEADTVWSYASGTEMDNNDVIGDGHNYVLCVRHSPANGHGSIEPGTDAVINGADGYIGSSDNGDKLFYYAFTAQTPQFATQPTDDTKDIGNDCETTFDDGLGASYYTVYYYDADEDDWYIAPSSSHLTEKSFSYYSAEADSILYKIEAYDGENNLLATSDSFRFIWEGPTYYMVSYNENGGTGTMIGDMIEEGEQFTLEPCDYDPPISKCYFEGWAIGNVDATPLKQAGDKITINEETIIYAIWHDHDLQSYTEHEATCIDDGNLAYWKCSTCQLYFSDAEATTDIELEDAIINKLGHDWGEWIEITPATETTEGLERRTCTRNANHIDERSIPMIGHVHTCQAVAAKAATCTEAGNTAHYECTGCHHYFSDQAGNNEINAEAFTIPATGHSWGEWTVTTDAQVGVPGVETRVCNNDANHKDTRPVPALPYPSRDEGGVQVYEATATAGQAKDVATLFEQAKAANGKVELTVGTLKITFNPNAVNAIGGNAASITANVITNNLEIEGAQLVVEITFTGSTFANGKATIVVPFTTQVPEGKVAKVYYVNGNEKTDMNAVFANGNATFETNHFSKFAVIFENANQPVNPDQPEQPDQPSVQPAKKGLSGGAIAGIVIAIVVVLAGAGVGIFFLLKKKGVIGKK